MGEGREGEKGERERRERRKERERLTVRERGVEKIEEKKVNKKKINHSTTQCLTSRLGARLFVDLIQQEIRTHTFAPL